MEQKPQLEDLLEICLITYNRSASLDNTLDQLKDSPLTGCRFTVLDNFSTDDTPHVVEKYAHLFKNYHIVRHNRNIGGDYNYLRAIEVSSAVYTWILCDDDNYDFTNFAPIVEAILARKYDLIYVASRGSDQLGCDHYGDTTVSRLLEGGAKYYRGCTFWPALIFKTEMFTNDCIHDAPYLYPSFKFINKTVNDNFSIYISEHPIVIRYQASSAENNPLSMYKEWVEIAAKITDKGLKYKVIEDRTDKGFVKTLCFWIALERSGRTPGYWKRLVDILFALTPLQKIKFLTLFPVMIIPIPIQLLVRARELVYRLMGHKEVKNLPPVHVEHR